MTSFVIYAVYVASNVCFLRAVAARSVVHVRAFILGAPVWCACAVHGVRLVLCVGIPSFAHRLTLYIPEFIRARVLCKYMPFLYSYDLLYTLLALRATVRFHLRCYAGLRPRPQHAPPALYTHPCTSYYNYKTCSIHIRYVTCCP